MPKILDYFKQTAMVNPYANLTFVDPKGRLYKFTRATTEMPEPPKETLPHPYGVDVELLQRLIMVTPFNNMTDFLTGHFHRVGAVTALKFLIFSDLITFTCSQHGKIPTDQIKLVDNKPVCPQCGKDAQSSKES